MLGPACLPCLSQGVPIPGSRDKSRIDENAASAEFILSPEDTKELRALAENAEVSGTRNLNEAWILEGVEGKCIPLEQWTGQRV